MNKNQPSQEKVSVKINTNKGDMVFTLFPHLAPKTVENFLGHINNSYYDNTIFHRIIENFMIQGGDPQGTGMGGESIWGKPFEDECHEDGIHLKGALSMANAGPNTNGSQFFIVHANSCDAFMLQQLKRGGVSAEILSDYETYGGTPWLDGKHTVFGQITEGLETLEAIAKTPVAPGDAPITPVVIESMEILPKNN